MIATIAAAWAPDPRRPIREDRIEDLESTRSTLIVVGFVAGLATIVFAGVAATLGVAALHDTLVGHPPPMPLMVLLAVAMFGGGALVFAASALGSARHALSLHRIATRGVRVPAQLLGMRTTGTRINRRRLWRISLRVRPGDAPPRTLDALWYVPRDASQLPPGTWLVALIDPADPTRAIVDWTSAIAGPSCPEEATSWKSAT